MDLPHELKEIIFEKRIYLAISHTFTNDISTLENKEYQLVSRGKFFRFYKVDWFTVYSAITSKKLALFYWCYQVHPNYFHGKILDLAVKSGTLEMVEFLIARGFKCSTRGMEWAGVRGDLSILKLVYTHFPETTTPNTLYEAARNGHLDIIQWFHEQNRGDLFTPSVMDLAAEGGHLEMIKWLHWNRHEGCTTSAIGGATLGDHFHVVKWLVENRNEGWTDWAINLAAINGNLPIIKLLAEKRDYPDAIRFAREHSCDRGEIIKFLESLKK